MRTDDTRHLAEGYLIKCYWGSGEITADHFTAWADEAEVPLWVRPAIKAEARRMDAIMDIDGSNHELAAALMCHLTSRLQDAALAAGSKDAPAVVEAWYKIQDLTGRLTGAYPAKVMRVAD